MENAIGSRKAGAWKVAAQLTPSTNAAEQRTKGVRMRTYTLTWLAFLLFAAFFAGCGDDDDDNSDNPEIDPANFQTTIDNQYLPFTPGTIYSYEDNADGEVAEGTIEVTAQTKVIMGVTCVVVHDYSTLDGVLQEDTYDWYAQDLKGNVWYFGEDTKAYDNNEVDTSGSWEAGVDGAKPGIVMEATPTVGDKYRQEHLKGVAEDWSEILEVDVSVTIALGTYDHCVRTKDWSPLEPDTIENKWFCPGIGQVLAETVKGDPEREELTGIQNP
jgi:hypothetical protein